MAWVNDYRAGHIVIENAGQQTITAITRLRVAANSNVLKEMTSGSAYNLASHVVAVNPVMSITTLHVADAFENLGIAGICTADMKAYGQKQDCSGVVGTAVHDEYAVTNACIVPTTLSVDHQGNAELSYDIYAASPNGTTDPVTRTIGQSLPALATVKRFEMYNMTAASVTLEGKRNITINWNPTVTQEGADTTQYPTVVTLSSVQPTTTVRGVDPDWWQSQPNGIPLGGASGTESNTIIRLKDRNQSTVSFAHVEIAQFCSVSWNTLFDAGPDAPAETELQLDAYSLANASPLNITTGVALT